MKLSTIVGQGSPLNDPSRIDLDVTARLGPAIQQHLTGLETLCNLIPNSGALKEKIDEIRSMFSSVVPLGSNVLEAENPAPRVYDYDQSKAFSQQMARTGAGAERIGYLPVKIVNEAGRAEKLVKDIDIIERLANEKSKGMKMTDVQDSIDQLIHFNKQLTNTVMVFNDAVIEMKSILAKRTRITENSQLLDDSVVKLEDRLTVMLENGSTLDYDSIDEVMQQICREDGCAPSDLHDRFVEKHGSTPDDWVKAINEGILSNLTRAVSDVGSKILSRLGISPDSIKAFYKEKGRDIALAMDEFPTKDDLEQPGVVHGLISNIVNKLAPNGKNNEEIIRAVSSAIQGTITGVINTGKPEIIIPIIGIVSWHYLHKKMAGNQATTEQIEDLIRETYVMEMYETMKIGLGEKAWVAISKRLRTQGLDAELVEKIINQAIISKKIL
jgi:hypothetical protein